MEDAVRDIGIQLYLILEFLIIGDCEFTQDTFRSLAAAFPSVKHLTCIRLTSPIIDILRKANYLWKEIATVHLTEGPKDTDVDPPAFEDVRPPSITDQQKRRFLRVLECIFYAKTMSFGGCKSIVSPSERRGMGRGCFASMMMEPWGKARAFFEARR